MIQANFLMRCSKYYAGLKNELVFPSVVNFPSQGRRYDRSLYSVLPHSIFKLTKTVNIEGQKSWFT